MPLNVTNLLADWPSDAAAAVEVQQRLRHEVNLTNDVITPCRVIGLDVGYDPATNTSHAVGVLMQQGEPGILASARAQLPTTFPYIPGFLSFREVPVLLAVLEQLPTADLLMIDGQGVAHPRRFGIACHLGVLTNMPTIGVAKSRLCGHHAVLADEVGATVILKDQGEQIGTVLRSKANCLPLYISPGHRIDQATALAVTKQWLRGYRLPEPTRLADKLSKKAEREQELRLL